MATDLIRYDLMVQDALRSVVRNVLTEAAKNGLPGDHHFYITFKTNTPGLRLSNRMRERYPDEMTIILQHQFWDLAVTEHAFEVGLSFNKAPERLLVPFEAITSFVDPSVQFGLKFEPGAEAESEATDEADAPEEALAFHTRSPAPVEKLEKAKGKTGEPVVALKPPSSLSAPPAKPASKEPKLANKSPTLAAVPKEPAAGEDSGDKIVSIDAFRKKP